MPRSLLNLVRFAGEGALRRGSPARAGRLLAVSDLEAAQRETGEQRLRELREEHPVAERLRPLRGMEVPFLWEEAVERLSVDPRPGEDGYGADGTAVAEALVGLGALIKRTGPRGGRDLRVDTPELLRQALDMKRRGGVRKAAEPG